MSKNVFIINLLWISRCKREGKRLPEKDFIIERPQGLVIAGKKRRKSMEPGKVRALVLNELEASCKLGWIWAEVGLISYRLRQVNNNCNIVSSSSEGSTNDDSSKIETRRQTIATSNWTARDFKRPTAAESLNRKRHIQEAEAYDEEGEEEILQPRLSLPISVESIASRHVSKKQKTPNIISVHAPSMQMKEQIKARFSIGQAPSSKPVTKASSNNSNNNNSGNTTTTSNKIDDTLRHIDSSISTMSSPTQVNSTPIKRKRRLTGSLNRPSISSTIDTLQPPKLEISEKPRTIVLTSVTPSHRKKYEEIIKKLGRFQIATE